MSTVTISLPDSLRDFLESQVKTKGYENASEYLRELLQEAQQREADARLEDLLVRGLDSGEDIELTPEYRAAKKGRIISEIRQRKQIRR